MDDLPRELREMADHLWDVEHRINIDDDTKTLKSAAAEIEQLRAALMVNNCNGEREMDKPYCCKIGCEKEAEYELRDGPQIHDYTHSCLEHIPEMMSDAPVHTVTRLAEVNMRKGG